MSKHKRSSLVFAIIIIVEVVSFYFGVIPISILVYTVAIFSLILALGSYYLRFQYYLPSINKLNGDGKVLTLTFDDGPNETVTPKLLDILKKHDIKVMFFCVGNHINNNIELAKEIVKQGHVLGNHSYFHKGKFTWSNYNKVKEELRLTNALIDSITLRKNIYFRPPFGVTNPIIARVVESENLKVVGWSLRSFDTMISQERLLKKLKKSVKPNDIILLHELETSLVAVDQFIKYAKQEGYEFVLPEIKN